VNVEGVVARGDEYLLIERAPGEDHAPGALAFPGGKVEQSPGGDAPIEATARRELSEEIGIEVGAVDYVHSRTFETDPGARRIDVITLCEHDGGTARPRAPEEVTAVHWLSADEISDHGKAPEYLEREVRRIEAYRRTTRG